LEQELTETRELKKTLALLSLSVIGVEAATFLLGKILPYVFYFLKAGSWGENEKYLALWIASDINVYLPAFLIFYPVFKNRRFEPEKKYGFKYVLIPAIFVAAETVTTAASYLSQILEYLLRPIFGSNGLRDVFEDVMPAGTFQTLVMFFVVVITGPICEELIFRSILLKPLRRFGDMQAVVITAVLFGFFHGNLTQFLYASAAGVILGITAVRANSVAASICLHILLNGSSFLRSQLYGAAEAGLFPDGYVTLSYLGLLLIGVISLIILIKSGRLKLENNNPHLTGAERARAVLQSPFILIMTIVLIVITVRGS